MNRKLVLFLALILSGFAAVIGTGIGYRDGFEPERHPAEFLSIAADGWIETGSTISLTGLAPFANRLKLDFDFWRPGTKDPAHLNFSVCGEPRGDFLVTKEDPNKVLAINGNCEPRTVQFQVVNPVHGSETDRRELGAKLRSAEVTSRLGFPIAAPKLVVSVTLAIAVLSLLTFFVLPKRLSLFSLLPALLAPFLLDAAGFYKWQQLSALWLFFMALAVGVWLSERSMRPSAQASLVSDAAKPALLLALIALCLGGIFRFYGLDFGLPFTFHSDEPRKVAVIQRMIQAGSWDPNYFLHPSQLLYLTIAISKIITLAGIDIPAESLYFVSGRAVSAIAGTASIWILYLIGRRLLSAWSGAVASLILAVLPLHITCSRYMKEDALLVFWLLATVLFTVKAVQEKRVSRLYIAGLFAGFTASSKYTGMLAMMVVASAPWLAARSFTMRSLVPSRDWLRPTFFALCAAPLGFVLLTPYSLLNWQKFSIDFGSEGSHMMRGHTSAIDAWSQLWMYHLSQSVFPGMTIIAAVIGLIGIGVLVRRWEIPALFVVGLALMFYLPSEWVKAKPAPQPERYILPCLPFLALAAAEALSVLRKVWGRGLAMALVALVVTTPTLRSFQLASELRYDTRLMMADWMRENLPAEAKLYINGEGYSSDFRNGEFEVYPLSRTKPQYFEVGYLRSSGKDYLLLSSLAYDRFFFQPGTPDFFRERFEQIFERLPLVKEMKPEFGTYGFHNPTLRLYALNEPALDQARARMK